MYTEGEGRAQNRAVAYTTSRSAVTWSVAIVFTAPRPNDLDVSLLVVALSFIMILDAATINFEAFFPVNNM